MKVEACGLSEKNIFSFGIFTLLNSFNQPNTSNADWNYNLHLTGKTAEESHIASKW